MPKRVLTLRERFGSEITTNKMVMDKVSQDIRVAIPGIITAFDIQEQTVTVQPAIMELHREVDGRLVNLKLPELLDVPIVFPRSGGFSLTMPVSAGDECLIIFADMCIDNWWASGGVQSQDELRRHDLSDSFAILGAWSQAHKVKNYSSTKARFVHEQSGAGIEIGSDGVVNLIGTIKKNGTPL